MSNTLAPIKIFAGENSKYLGESICKELGIEMGKMNKERFADGEFEVSFEESIRGAELYLVQSTFPTSENLMELLLMVDAAKRASAASICAVVPYFGWARQDRKDKPRVSIAAKLVADLLSVAGINRLITMDLHADQIQGFFDVPVDHLYASSIFIPYIQSLKLKDMVIASPDVGGAKRANSYAKYFDVPLVLCHKSRAKANVIATMTVIGDVKDKNVVLVDDIVDTAGTITKSADLLMAAGAKSVRALCSHPVMSDPATERILDSGLSEIIFTDSIPYVRENHKATILPVAKLFADTIRRIHNNQSISSQYLFK
ncbi:MAG: ribose-phosphate pyrophosphokinase [Candidatus Amulumruptor caecigallinarius]|nr:ribose-phosphate pyrophosphokinase [Candidatus Amulumruptor caecigallinarius]